jgi:hypothetical protein
MMIGKGWGQAGFAPGLRRLYVGGYGVVAADVQSAPLFARSGTIRREGRFFAEEICAD